MNLSTWKISKKMICLLLIVVAVFIAVLLVRFYHDRQLQAQQTKRIEEECALAAAQIEASDSTNEAIAALLETFPGMEAREITNPFDGAGSLQSYYDADFTLLPYDTPSPTYSMCITLKVHQGSLTGKIEFFELTYDGSDLQSMENKKTLDVSHDLSVSEEK